MTATSRSSIKTINVAGVGPVELTVEERGDGHPFLVLHGGAGPQSVSEFAQLLAEKGHNLILTPTHPGFGGTTRPETLDNVAKLADLYRGLLDQLGLEDVTVRLGRRPRGIWAPECAYRPGLERLLERDAIDGFVDRGGIQTRGEARIERVAAQVAVEGCAHGRHAPGSCPCPT